MGITSIVLTAFSCTIPDIPFWCVANFVTTELARMYRKNGGETNQQLIKQTTQDTDSGDGSIPYQLKYGGLLALVCTPILVAGFWQDEPLLEATSNIYAIEQAHPHTMPLLSAAITSVQKEARGGAELLVSEGALIATGGPVGESEYAPSGSSEIRVYTVREGDTLSRVAEMFGSNYQYYFVGE